MSEYRKIPDREADPIDRGQEIDDLYRLMDTDTLRGLRKGLTLAASEARDRGDEEMIRFCARRVTLINYELYERGQQE